MPQTQKTAPPRVATIPPILRQESETRKGLKSETKEDLLKIMGHQAERVRQLAQEYENTGSSAIRNKLNQENLHLHGQIHVFWTAMKNEADPKALSDEQKHMSELQASANKALEDAARARGDTVYYVSISDIRSSTGERAGEHIYKNLVHPDSNTLHKLISSVENGVLDALRDKGFDDYEFMNRLFMMSRFMRNDRSRAAEPPAGQVGGSKKGDTEMVYVSAEELVRHQEEYDKMRAELERTRSQLKREEDIAKLREQSLIKTRQNNSELSKELAEAQAELQREQKLGSLRKRNLDAAVAERDKLGEGLQKAQGEIRETKEELTKTNRERDSLKGKLGDTKKKLAKTKKERDGLGKELGEAKSELTKLKKAQEPKSDEDRLSY
ncbi:MAG: hypothetical protein KGH94_02485 [Candidatus Micrarchaeota archaeon]|nr:hypothetical protein [Candidatus Micrarchaeota archaeon]